MSEDMKHTPNATGEENNPPKPDHMRTRLNSEKLFCGSREVIIEHAGDEYRLRLTSQGKLILTK